MAANGGEEPWRQSYEANAAELARSQRLTNQFRQVLQPLRKRAEDLEAERERLAARSRADDECVQLEVELAQARAATVESRERREVLQVSLSEKRREAEAEEAAASRRAQEAAEAAEAEAECRRRREAAEERRTEILAEARSMVSADALERAEVEAQAVRSQLVEQEAEASRLREALADAWAARSDPLEDLASGAGSGNSSAAPNGSSQGDAAALDRMEEELRWLAEVQQSAASETRKLQKLERSEAKLHAELREASEEKAALQSSRVDICDTGRAMREAIAFQSDSYVKRCDDLEDARRSTDADRVKLLQECAELQAKLTELEPRLAEIQELEQRHQRLEGERKALADESARLREVNGALGFLMMGDEDAAAVGGDAGGLPGAIRRVLQLHVRLTDRLEAHTEEKQKLADRIRQLEREAATGGGADASSGAGATNLRDLPGARPAPAASSSAGSAVKALRGGLGGLLRGK
eukprot:TRINITY_DN16295_c0_g1_i1.p1 TRINITY_DN16295_c0_g1~~TRINITY_DN16295_c0_g1_i1.p1  ORF type:complete len:487 (+),score=155.68 TRINITY_DN16295_c0_g1_i1:51-1463(+)